MPHNAFLFISCYVPKLRMKELFLRLFYSLYHINLHFYIIGFLSSEPLQTFIHWEDEHVVENIYKPA
jgi:hypothetical protein